MPQVLPHSVTRDSNLSVLDWTKEALKTCPSPIQNVATMLFAKLSSEDVKQCMATTNCQSSGPIALVATAARLACVGLSDIVKHRQPSMCLILEAAAAALTLYDESNDEDFKVGDESGQAMLREVSTRVYLGLAITRLDQQKFDASLEALSVADRHVACSAGHLVSIYEAWQSMCISHVVTYRRMGRLDLALAALGLLRSAVPKQAAVSRTQCKENWVLRQQTACHLAAGNTTQAFECAEKAIAHDTLDSDTLFAGLRLALRACCREACGCVGKSSVARVAAMNIARRFSTHANVCLNDIVCACRELVDHGICDVAAAVLSDHRERSIQRSMASAEVEQDLCTLELLVCAHQIDVTGMTVGGNLDTHFDSLTTTAQLGAGGGLATYVTAHHWNVACRALSAGEMEVAVGWLQRMLNDGCEDGVGPIAALAFCLWCQGQLVKAQSVAESALARDASDPTALAVSLVAHACDGKRCVGLVSSHEDAAKSMTAIAVSAFSHRGAAWPSDAALLWLEAIVHAIAGGWLCTPSDNAYMPDAVSGLMHIVDIVYPDDEKLMICLRTFQRLCTSVSLGHVVRRIAEFMWNFGARLGRNGRWELCALSYEIARDILQSLGDMGDLHIAEEIQMCAVVHIAALLEVAHNLSSQPHANTTSHPDVYGRVRAAAHHARSICARYLGLRTQHTPCGEMASSPDQAWPLMVLMEFEARARSVDPELCIYIAEVAAFGPLHPRCYLVMSRLALNLGNREAATHCLRIYLRACIEVPANIGGTNGCMAMFSMSLREMVKLCASRNDSIGCFEELLALFRSTHIVSQVYPERELQWLVAVSWNNGAHYGKAQDIHWAHQWIGVAVGLSEFCPLPEHRRAKMLEAHAVCRRHLGWSHLGGA